MAEHIIDMKWIFALALLSLLVSGCTQAGMIAGAGDSCRPVNHTYTEIARLSTMVLGVDRQISWSRDLGYYAEGTVILKNTDNESGWFMVTFEWIMPGENPQTERVSKHLNPGDAEEFKSICPDIDPLQGALFRYQYTSYPDSGRTVERQMEKQVCG